MKETPVILSSAQARLWFLDTIEPGSALYNSPIQVWLRGKLSRTALEEALALIQQRHEILRTIYRSTEDGSPVQVVLPPAPVALDMTCVEDVLAPDREPRAIELSLESGNRAFDLANGPVMRCQLVRLEAEVHLLTISIHHIAGDGWSLGILCQELAAFYAERAFGQPANLAELPVQYADYALWQRERLGSPELRRGLDYWTQKLEGAPARVDLLPDRPRPAVQSYRGRTVRHRVSAGLRDQLFALGRREQASAFMVLLAGFQALLHSYTGAEDLAVGSPVANRNREEIEGLIGCFINTLVLRTRFSAQQSFRELLRQTRETVLEAFAHQEVPFEEIINALQPERNLSTSPLFNVLFLFHNFRFQTGQAGPLTFRPELAFTETSKFDLSLFVFEAPEHLEFLAEYNCDLFDASTMARLLENLEGVLVAVVNAPERPLAQLPLSVEARRSRQQTYWKGQLEGKLPAVQIPGVRVRLPQLSGKRERYHFQLKEDLQSALREAVAASSDALLNRLLSAFFALLYRYAGAEDLLVGVSGMMGERDAVEVGGASSPGALPLRVRLDGQMSFKELSEKLGQSTRAAWAHRGLPSECLVDMLKAARPEGVYSLFQFMFAFRSPHQKHASELISGRFRV